MAAHADEVSSEMESDTFQNDEDSEESDSLDRDQKTKQDGFGKDGDRTLLHRFRHNSSILCLTTANDRIYAGTQAGEILIFTLDTYQQEHVIRAHHGSVLGLCLSTENSLLFSSAGDRLVNIWNTKTFQNIASIYSLYDVGDIFCISYSSSSRTLYLGCQNTSIQWCNLASYDSEPSSDPQSHPSLRQDRFFDSPGPGGIRDPKQRARSRGRVKAGARLLQIPKEQIHQFAHYGYVHAMLLNSAPVGSGGDEEMLVSAGGDGAINLWALDRSKSGTPRLLKRLEDSREGAESILAIASEGQFLFSGRVDGEVNVWDLETRQLLRVLKPFDSGVLTLSLGLTGIFTASECGHVKVYNPQYDCIEGWRAHAGKILASVYTSHQSRNMLITGGNDNSVAVWKVKGKAIRRAISTQEQEGTISPSTDESSKTKTSIKSLDELLESLRTFISFRTVSSDPKCKAECHRGASYLRSLLRKFGATTEMISTEDDFNPIVLGRFGAPPQQGSSSNKILFYGHYDVIAAENKQGLWIQDPFSMIGQDGYLYGRGASDNKGPILSAIYAVADIVQSKQLKSEIIFLIEGEEERGSRGFEDAIRKHKHLIGDIDWILVANSYWIDDEVPCLTFGLRGVLHATVQIESELPDLHSGVDGSRLLDEPLKDLVLLTSNLTGPKGTINVPSFNDAILPMSESEKALYDKVAQSLVARTPGLGPPESLAASLIQRWCDASLTIHGFKTSGSEKSTIIPHFASAAISMRLVPNQESQIIAKSLRAFLEAEFRKLGSKNTLTIEIHQTAEPWLGDPTNDLFRSLERAVQDVWMQKASRRASLGAPASPSINPSHIRHRPSRTSSRRSSTPATSSTLASGGIAPLTSTDDESAIGSPQLLPLRPKSPSFRQDGLAEDTKSWCPLYIREGGSIPAIRFLEKEFNAPAAQLPCGQASDNAHLDNERLRVLNLLNSREIFRKVFVELTRS